MTSSGQPPSPSATALDGMTGADTGTLERFYDGWAKSYDSDLRAMGYAAPGRAAAIMRDFGIGRSQPVLDAGCGTGLTGVELRRCGFTAITGVDVSAASLEEARAKGCYATLKRQDLNETLAVPDAAFAAAQCIGTLTYVSNVEGLMREFCRVVRSGGIVTFTHRVDLRDDNFVAVLDRLVAEGRWSSVARSAPQTYLPGHEDFSRSEKAIIYDTFRIA